jgi:hypothetical protein
MAAFLDLSLLGRVSVIFIGILVFAVVYGMLEHSGLFGKSKNISAIIAFIAAILIVVSRPALAFIDAITPWLLILVIVGFFILFFVRMLGVSEETIVNNFTGNNKIMNIIIVFVALIVIFGLANVFGQGVNNRETTGTEDMGEISSSENTSAEVSGGENTETDNILFHPKVLGMLVFLVIGLFTVLTITQKVVVPK